MKDQQHHSGISMHSIKIDANIPGLLFTLGCLGIFLVGVPAFRGFLALSIAAGAIIAVVLRILHR